MAIEPVDARGELAPTATVTVRPETVADTELSGDDDADGEVGLPPPHAAAPAMARKAADLLQLAQKSRRVVVIGFVRSFTVVTSLGQSWPKIRGLLRYQQEP
jgi:hypothetical protein